MRLLFTFIAWLSFSVVSAQIPAPKYEFRGVWVATVENIDYPSKNNLLAEDQKAEFIRLLNMHYNNGMNAVIVQIRPAADAFYASPYEPWSQYLTGVQGKAPFPYYDPLQFMIEETHKRGMEFHAWLNPYRAVFNINRSSIAPDHITRQKPQWFVNYGNIKYFDPANPEARAFVANVVKDIVERYDVDAIHMDDYFYPYKIPGKEFPDHQSYLRNGGGLTKSQWRRSNCDSIVSLLHRTIRSTRPSVKFGISPFGVWRNSSADPRGSQTTGGLNNYDDLYADILLWMEKGWIDYVAPQLYWEIGHKSVDFETLASWWNANSYGTEVYIGHGIYRANSNNAWKNRNEIPNQIKYVRSLDGNGGSIFYSSNIFEKNPLGWNDSLQSNYYRRRALIPPFEDLTMKHAPKPEIDFSGIRYDADGAKLRLKIKNLNHLTRNYAIYIGEDNKIDMDDDSALLTVVPASIINKTSIDLPVQKNKAPRYLKITAVSTTNLESEAEDILLMK